jgi:hypothetical protein
MKQPVSFADLVDLADVHTTVGPAPAPRPLSERNRARVSVLREGALDYQNIPSRIGDQLVPHKAKADA